MEEMIGGSFVFVTGVIFLWLGLFQYKWLYKGIKEVEEGKIDIFPFIGSYWFWRIVFIGSGILLIFTTGNSFIRYVFLYLTCASLTGAEQQLFFLCNYRGRLVEHY